MQQLILASNSTVRAQLLAQASLSHTVLPARVDEDSAKESLLAAGATPRDIADALAELKARKISEKEPGALVLGCDQTLDFNGQMISKPHDLIDAENQLKKLRNARHFLFSAAVIYQNRTPIWRHIGQVRLWMRDLSDAYISDYVNRNWDSICHSVGCYKLEEEGVRLFSRVEGDYFNVLGLPLLEILSYLALRGDIET
ncbi:MAG: nucleoside triphosphate pyrophosphatase [Pseudomonadota bacterium]